MPPARTGREIRSKKVVIKRDQLKRSRRSQVEGRKRKIVTIKLSLERIEEAPAKCKEKMAVSTLLPG